MNTDLDRTVRVAISDSIRERGHIPTIAEVSQSTHHDVSEISEAFDRLAQAHVFIAQRGSREIYAYNPFCIGPTDFRVHAAGRDHWAICGWDALGIPAALRTSARVDTTCPDCGEPLAVDVTADGTASARTQVVFGLGVRAHDFWNDIYFT